MVILDGKPEITYPCRWSYRLIGRIRELMEAEIREIAGEKPYHLDLANTSRTGKFVSLNLTLEVCDEVERLAIYDRLTKSQVIMQVL